ncbi:MAG: Hpt domain-containing protein [Pseudomonas sp.]|uniref:Hpt domain-containing protein n=1 Tax=Pseudomonas sp. TaxID=306 RepID=UPI0023901F40|nr:Hpt domain-containing protein [Pseudomonas sp.]MDE1194011.1 Hpt domain-containing protein [Pseudomonas sp.]
MLKNHVDLGVLETLRDVMEGEYPSLLDVFIKDSEQRVRDLNGLTNDPGFSVTSTVQRQLMGEMAHSFKGSSSNMGATHLAELCRQLEDMGRGVAAVSDQQVRQQVQAIEDEFSIVRDLFDVELQSPLIRH